MKRIIIFIAIVNNCCFSQNNYSINYCINAIQLTKLCYSINSDSTCDNEIGINYDSIKYHFTNLMFAYDDSLYKLCIDSIGIKKLLKDKSYFDYESAISTNSSLFFELVNDYVLSSSLQFSNLSFTEKYSLLNNIEYAVLIKYLINQSNTSELINFIYIVNDEDRFRILYTLNNYCKISSKQDSIYSSIDSLYNIKDSLTLRELETYSLKIKYARNCIDSIKRDSIISLVQIVFNNRLDTTIEKNRNIYIELFRPQEFKDSQELKAAIEKLEKQKLALWRKDSIFQIQKREVDSIFQNHFEWRGLSPEELEHYRIQFETGEIYKNHYFYTHPILPDTNRMSAYEKFCYKVRKDTTLYTDDWKPKYYPGDGGRRFDTLTNKQLIAELSGYNYSNLHQQVRPWRDVVLDSSTDVVYLRKISQLIGDRALKGTLTMDSSDRVELNRLIDFCVDIMKHDSNHYWKSECEKILLRLWLPIKPRLLAALTDSNRIMYSFATSYLHAMVTESDVVSLVTTGMSYFNQGNRNEAMKYIMPLEPIADHLHAEEALHIMMPRRKALRDWETSVKWCGLYIYDALNALGYPK